MKLTDTQRALLEAAAQHPQKKLINFPDTIKGGARIKVLTSMHNAELIEPSAAEPQVFVATATGLQAIGFRSQAPRAKREGTKQAVLIGLALLLMLASSQLALTLVNWLVSMLVSPHPLPKMDFSKGIPQSSRTLVVVPTMLAGFTSAVTPVLSDTLLIAAAIAIPLESG